jgi:hypothetical protein
VSGQLESDAHNCASFIGLDTQGAPKLAQALADTAESDAAAAGGDQLLPFFRGYAFPLSRTSTVSWLPACAVRVTAVELPE